MKYFTYICLAIVFISVPTLAQAVTDGFTVSLVVTGAADTEAPTTPTNISATAVSSTAIDVSWDASTDNTAVSGYQVFRDSTQVATVTAPTVTYSDTGLTAATTYEYFVRAFDAANNISSSSATTSATTNAAAPTPTDSETSSGGYIPTNLSGPTVLVSTNDSTVTFSANTKIKYVLRWGETSSYELGTSQSVLNIKEYAVYIPDLQPGVTYYYQLTIEDRFGRPVEVIEDSFTTQTEVQPIFIPNVANFTANQVDDTAAVRLTWDVPTIPNYTVRLLRNPNFYPRHPADGYLVYEGTGTEVIDTEALLTAGQAYYTLFVIDAEGNYSSGALSLVEVSPAITPGAPVTPEVPVVTEPVEVVMGKFEDVIFRQDGLDRLFRGDVADVVSQKEFMVLLPAPDLDLQYIVLRFANDFTIATYLMQYDYESGFYTTAVPAMVAGEYAVNIEMYDAAGQLLSTISGVLQVTSPEVVPTTPWSDMAIRAAGVSAVFLLLLWLLIGLRLLWRLRADN